MQIPPESWSAKAKLASRTEMCILLGYGKNPIGFKVMSLRTNPIRSCRLENAVFQQDFTCESGYVLHFLENLYFDGDHMLASDLPIVHMKTDMESYSVDADKERPSVGVSAAPAKVTSKRK
ncbi:polyprotein [Phytophthora megakarya]|uniref:Polyprotein n=1 Tax=Phytophthora megakarya TaxID=4795 RepID=A0A225VP05_9STRA|nr:polyprotein [Phytophthora megakarya]